MKDKRASVAPMLGAIIASAAPRRPSDRDMVREHARNAKRHATEDWVAGRMTTSEHKAIHARADHVLAGRHPSKFKGKNGERKPRGLI